MRARCLRCACVPGGRQLLTLEDMSAERDELRRLVEELPDEQVPAALDEVRRQLQPAERARSWPPAWFGAAKGSRSDVAARSEELLADGFGRSH